MFEGVCVCEGVCVSACKEGEFVSAMYTENPKVNLSVMKHKWFTDSHRDAEMLKVLIKITL